MRVLSDHELELVSGGGFWQHLWGGVEHFAQDVDKGLVAGAITGVVGARWRGMASAPRWRCSGRYRRSCRRRAHVPKYLTQERDTDDYGEAGRD